MLAFINVIALTNCFPVAEELMKCDLK